MGGVLIAADNVGIGCQGWAYRAILCEVCRVVAEQGHAALAAWLADENSSVNLYDSLDARGLTPENQAAFRSAIVAAHERSKRGGGPVWDDRERCEAYSQLLSSLVDQMNKVAAGDNPTSWPNLVLIGPHTEGRCGPGWPDTAAD